MDIIDLVLEPLSFAFMQQAVAIAVIVALAGGLLSPFLVLKGWSLMGDAIAHAVLPGIVVAYVVGAPLIIGAFVAGMVCALLTGYLRDHSRVKEDTVMGVVFSGMFALGIVLFTMIETDAHLNHVLFGNILGISWAEVAEAGAISALVLVAVALRHRDLMLYVFDSRHARVIGINIAVLNYGLLALVALAIIAALNAVGMILAIALLIAPGAIAFLLTDRFGRMVAISVAASVVMAIAGVIASFHLDSAPAPTIVLGLTILFVLALVFAPKRGLLSQRRTHIADRTLD